MAKLIFRYGAMGASKSANALMVRFNYIERGMKVALLKPERECRDGKEIIHSRIGLKEKANTVEKFIKEYNKNNFKYDVIIIDEAQFLTKRQVDFFAHLVDSQNIPCICYGLRTDFQAKLFTGSKELFALADEIEEIPTICWCGKKARFNARIQDGKIVRTGDKIMLGGNESYVALCRKHFYEGKLSGEDNIKK